MKQFLTRPEAAAALRICARTLDRQIRNSGLPTAKIGGKVLIPCDDLFEWAKNLPSVVSAQTTPEP